jgi:hypothetical protein
VFELSPADRRPLDDFPLLYRWTRPEHQVLPAEALASIIPLSVQRASELAPDAAARCTQRRVAEWQLTISAEWDSPESVRDRLGELLVSPSTQVVVSWDQTTAVVMPWRTFVGYWEAFCYPSSDDVSVWEPGAAWTLCYRHFQVIEFGRTPPAA